MLLSVVSGTFNEVENVREFIRRVTESVSKIPDCDYEIIVIDNASTDGTQDELRRLAKENPKLKVILNTRNFGHVRSPYHGLLQAQGDCAAFLASDLQDPPELLPSLVEKWRAGFKSVVCVKSSNVDAPVFSLLRSVYYQLIGRLSDTELVQHFTGFGLYDKAVIEYCRQTNDAYPYFRGMISEMGFSMALVPYDKAARPRGLSKNNLYTLYDLAMLGITSHSKIPLRLATMLGFFLSFLSLLVAAGYLIYKLLFWYSFSAGMAPVIIGLFFFGSIQMFFIGILGEYIGAIHAQVLKRPLVVEKERINF